MPKYCENCGSKLQENADVCLNCGRIISKTVISTEKKDFTVWQIIGYVCATISVFLYPVFFAGAGVICGVTIIQKGEKSKGGYLIIVSVVCLVIGISLGAIYG